MNTNRFLHYILVVASALSSAAASMTLIALSTSLYATDGDGAASSMIYVLYYFGIGAVGLGGGWVLQKFTAIHIGVVASVCCSLLLFYLSSFKAISPEIGLPCIFIIFLFNGIDHPNSLRFFNEVLDEDAKLSFFSIKDTLSYIFNLAAPPLAALIITIWGARACFFIDAIVYLLGCIPWILLRRCKRTHSLETKVDIFAGFKLLYADKNIQNLTISRLLNNLAYVTWMTALPILIAKMAQGSMETFAVNQAFATSFLSAGFILTSMLALQLNKKREMIVPMIWGASFLGLIGVIFSVISLHQSVFLYLSAFCIGMGTYCFRLSGITLGQAFTPKEILGPVIIAGDAIVRSWSIFISLYTVAIFEFHEFKHWPVEALYALIVFLPLMSLAAPLILAKTVDAYVSQTHRST